MFFSHQRKVIYIEITPWSERPSPSNSINWREWERESVMVGGMQIRVATVRPACWFLNRLRTEPSHAPVLPLPGTSRRNLSLWALVIVSHFLYHGTVHHSQKAATWYPPTDEWTKKIHTAKYRSVKWSHVVCRMKARLEEIMSIQQNKPDSEWQHPDFSLTEMLG